MPEPPPPQEASTLTYKSPANAAALLKQFGAPIRDFIEKRLGIMFALFLAVLIGGFYVVKFL